MMINLLADSSIPGLHQAFPPPFSLSFYSQPQEIARLLPSKEILLCRSTLKVNESLLQNHTLKYVATASSGTDHIDEAFLNTRGITLFDAKGSNADAVADYVTACLAWLSVHKNYHGKKAAVIGYGSVGQKVTSRLRAAGLRVIVYDPPKAFREDTFMSCKWEELASCDLICVHANRHDDQPNPSLNLLDKVFFDNLKPNSVIINTSRGGIVNEEDLLSLQKPLLYCTDVYNNEPDIHSDIVNKATLCTPHIAGHSIEAKLAAVALLSQQLHACYLLQIPDLESQLRYALPAHLNDTLSWQAIILSLYNPEIESRQLKQDTNKKNAFLSLRPAHHFRHDFKQYDWQNRPFQLQQLAGFA